MVDPPMEDPRFSQPDYHRCPRRNENPASDTVYPGPDTWRENGWTLTEDQLSREQETLAGGGTRWRWPWQPRTCSYCGGAHPEDIMRLLEEGWENEKCDKGYKGYLHPPGHRASIEKALASDDIIEGLAADRDRWSAVPPVKLYVMHFTEDELQRLNTLIKGQA